MGQTIQHNTFFPKTWPRRAPQARLHRFYLDHDTGVELVGLTRNAGKTSIMLHSMWKELNRISVNGFHYSYSFDCDRLNMAELKHYTLIVYLVRPILYTLQGEGSPG